jgi:hypothetical protein
MRPNQKCPVRAGHFCLLTLCILFVLLEPNDPFRGLTKMPYRNTLKRLLLTFFTASALLSCLSSCELYKPKPVDLSGEWDLLHTEANGVVYPDEQAHGVHLQMSDSVFSIYRVRNAEMYHGRYLVQDDF